MVNTERTIKNILNYNKDILDVDEDDETEDSFFRQTSKKYNKALR
jgi:hypothetical protein